jgi:hypothetical protein
MVEQRVLGGFKIRPLTKIQYVESRSDEFIQNDDGTYDHEVDTVPVSLLRHFFRRSTDLEGVNLIKDYQKWKCILCKIEHTMQSLKESKISFKDIMKFNAECHNAEYTYGLSIRKFLEIFQSPDDAFLIIKSILVRVEFGHRLMKFFHTCGNKRLEFASQLFVDTHLDLIIHIINTNSYTDGILLDEYHVNNPDLQCSFKRFYPSDTNFAYCGDLPDFTTCIDLGNIWYDVRPRNNDLISHIIHIFASKVLKHKCSERNFIKITVDKYCKEFRVFNSIYRLLIEVSLMGNYPHAMVRASFNQRLEIRNEFHHKMTLSDDNILHEWMRENESIVVAISKEFHMFMVVSQMSLDNIMEETKNWKEIKLICVRSMDMIRSLLSNYRLSNMLSDGTRNEQVRRAEVQVIRTLIKDRLATLEQRMSVLLDKLKKCNFLDFMLFYIEKHYEKFIVNKKSTSSIDIEDIISKEVLSGIDLVAMYASVKYKNYIPTKYLKCFGVSRESYEMIRDFYFRYEMSNIPDNSVKSVLMNIHNHSKEDFFLIRAYFQAIRQYKFFELYPYTMEHFENLIYSLRLKHMVPPWVPLNEEHTRFYFCIICKKWACPVVDPNSLSTVVDVFSLGKEKVSRDPYTGKLYCGKQVTSIIIKNLIESEVYFHDGPIEDEGLAKAIRNHKSSFNCTTTPLTFVHLPGRMLSIIGKKWVVCSICGQPTIFEGAKLDTNGFTCCFHEKSVKKRKRSISASSMKHKKESDILVKTRVDYGLLDGDINLDFCGYCGNECDRSSCKIKIVDDIGTLSSYKISLCQFDYDLVKSDINTSNRYMKSKLFDIIATARAKNTGVYKGRRLTTKRSR